MKSPNQNIRVWRQNRGFFQCTEGSVGELVKRSHLWLLLCLLYCLELVGWWSFPKREAELKIASEQILLTCLFLFAFWLCTANKKNITHLPLKWFSVDKLHLKNPEGKQRKCFCVCLYCFVAWEQMDW